MYPIKFKSLYYKKVWGGYDFNKFRNDVPEGKVGESWDIACHKNGTGIVANGTFKGMRFDELIRDKGKELFGKEFKNNEFPLLVKLINSDEKLSVQVHPGDEYARINENDNGKTEAWYIVDAKPNASIIIGTQNCSKEEFEKAIKENDVEKYLNKIAVKKGDSFLINSGLVHAICEGVIIAEIQQNSDITYRVYDYGRAREIHVEKALDVIDLSLDSENLKIKETNKNLKVGVALCENEYFGIKKFEIKDKVVFNDENNYYILTAVDGNGVIKGKNFKETINKGDSYLMPINLGEYEITGTLVILKSYAI